MKFVKGISLFFVIPILLLAIGFFVGKNLSVNDKDIDVKNEKEEVSKEDKKVQFRVASTGGEQLIDADTDFCIEEVDLRRDSVVETECELPDKYIGMDRESFVEAMEEYELTPPLSELERGFVSLEVKSFSEEQVVVRMNYSYPTPSPTFYLMAENHMIVVYCDDKTTLYMKTNITLDTLPDILQYKIINGMFVEDEKTLYYFLESYSS